VTGSGAARDESASNWQPGFELELTGEQRLTVELHPGRSTTLPGESQLPADGVTADVCGTVEELFDEGDDEAYRQAPVQRKVLRARLLALGKGADAAMAEAVEQLLHPPREESAADRGDDGEEELPPTTPVDTPEGLMFQRIKGRRGRESVLIGGPRFDDFNVLILMAPVLVLPPSFFFVYAPLANRFRYDLLTYIGLGWLLVFLLCAAAAARTKVNRRMVRVDPDGLTLSEGPIPWGGGGRIPASRVRMVRAGSHVVRLQLTRGGERTLMEGLEDEQSTFVRKVVAGELGLEPRSIDPAETREKDRAELRGLVGGGLFTSLPVLFGLNMLCFRCPEVTDNLGGEVTWAAGFSSYSGDAFNDDDNDVHIKVRGSRGGGEVWVEYGKRDDGSRYYRTVSIDMLGPDGKRQTINLRPCVRDAERPDAKAPEK
jgi:hypothetical protein